VSNQELTARWQGALMNNYGTRGCPSSAVRAPSCGTPTASSTPTSSAVSRSSARARPPAIVEAVSRQIASLGHVSNLFVAEPPVALAERLLQHFGRDGKVFFCNSGAEANEGAFKIAG